MGKKPADGAKKVAGPRKRVDQVRQSRLAAAYAASPWQWHNVAVRDADLRAELASSRSCFGAQAFAGEPGAGAALNPELTHEVRAYWCGGGASLKPANWLCQPHPSLQPRRNADACLNLISYRRRALVVAVLQRCCRSRAVLRPPGAQRRAASCPVGRSSTAQQRVGREA